MCWKQSIKSATEDKQWKHFHTFCQQNEKNGERSWKIPKKETHDHEIAHISN